MLVADFLRFILPDVPGCPSATVTTALMRAAQDLCRRADVWSEIQDPVALQDNNNEYSIDPPGGAMTHNVIAVQMGPIPLTPKSQLELPGVLSDWQTATSSLPMYYNGAREWGSIRVYPIPVNCTTLMTVHAVYAPKLGATALPDFLTDRFHDELMHGAKGRLFAMRQQQWTAADLAQYHLGEFDRLVENARIQTLHSRIRTTMRVPPRRFGG